MSQYYIINSDRKAELYIGYEEYKKLPENQKKSVKSFFNFSRAKSAWISKGLYNSYSVTQIIKDLNLPLQGREERKTFQEKQDSKITRAENRINRFEKYSDNAKKRAEQLQSEFNRLRKDWSWLTQPIIRGHSGSERFGRSKQRVLNKYESGFKEYEKSDYFKQRAQTSMYTAEQRQLKDPSYLNKKIKEAETTIKKVTPWVEKYSKSDNEKLIAQYGAEKINNWILDGLEKIQEAYEKLAFYSYYLDVLKNSGVKVFNKQTLQGAEYVKIRGSWYKVLNINPTTVTHSWFVGSFKHPYGEVQDAIFKGENYQVKPGRVKGDFEIIKISSVKDPKYGLKKGHELMQKAIVMQKESGTKTKTVYKMPIQKALKIVSKK